MAKKYEAGERKEKRILDEIVEKADDFETRQTSWLAEVAEWSDLYKVKPPKRQSNTFSNPRQTEFFRSSSAVSTLGYRMMTSADPFFQIVPVDFNADYDKLDTIKHTWLTQLKWARYRENLLRAWRFLPVYGTVICQEDYRVMGVSPYGRRIPVTTLTPRVLDQVMFDRDTLNIHEALWLQTADITSSADLMRLAAEAKAIKAPWNPEALEAASKDKEEKTTINWRVLERLRRAGLSIDEALSKKKELLMYYGKLDCMNDGIEYVAAVVNRKHLVRFHANNSQHGRRNFRVAKWIDFDGPMGLGNGSLLAAQHRAMDANRQKAQDLLAFGAYNMWGRKKGSFADEDAVLKPLAFFDMDGPGDMWPLSPDYRAAEGILRLDEFLKQEFKAASLGTDTLQGIASEATTATQSGLAQNEALRAISVIAEQVAEALGREHLENNHANNGQNINAPFNINKAGVVKKVYPSDLKCDLEIEIKIATDKDFATKRLERLIQVLQILTSTKSDHPDQAQVSILPIVKEIAYGLEVNPNEVIMKPNGMPVMPMMGANEMMGLGGGLPGPDGPGPVSTPIGPVLAS